MPKTYKGDELKAKLREVWLEHTEHQINRSKTHESQTHIDVILSATDDAVDAMHSTLQMAAAYMTIDERHIIIAVSNFASGVFTASALYQSRLNRKEQS